MTLDAHLATGVTTVARAWAVARRDGVTLGFTDHDRPLAFDGLDFRPETGLTAQALVQGTGLAVDNAEALGALSSGAVTEADIEAGRYDGAEIRLWHVNWADVAQRALRFRGTIGEIVREGAAFRAELRGLTEALNRPLGRLYARDCQAVLGDAACRVDLDAAGVAPEAAAGDTDGAAFALAGLDAYPAGWFERGRLVVLTGAAAGLSGVVRLDRPDGAVRRLELWSALRAPLAPLDRLRLEPGCDKRAETCRAKFANIRNFRGFPFIPGEDWLMAHPLRAGINDGGRLR